MYIALYVLYMHVPSVPSVFFVFFFAFHSSTSVKLSESDRLIPVKNVTRVAKNGKRHKEILFPLPVTLKDTSAGVPCCELADKKPCPAS